MQTQEDVRREQLEYNPFANGGADHYPLPISTLARQITKYPSDRADYPKYKITTIKETDLTAIKDFLTEHNYPFMDLNLDSKKLSLKKHEKDLDTFFQNSLISVKDKGFSSVFLFGLEALADGGATKAKTNFLRMVIYRASRYFDRPDNIFLIATKDFIQNIKSDDDGWFEGRIRLFESY